MYYSTLLTCGYQQHMYDLFVGSSVSRVAVSVTNRSTIFIAATVQDIQLESSTLRPFTITVCAWAQSPERRVYQPLQIPHSFIFHHRCQAPVQPHIDCDAASVHNIYSVFRILIATGRQAKAQRFDRAKRDQKKGKKELKRTTVKSIARARANDAQARSHAGAWRRRVGLYPKKEVARTDDCHNLCGVPVTNQTKGQC